MTSAATTRLPAETWVFLVVGAALVAGFMLGAGSGAESALVVALALAVAIAGLPHGALDPLVAHHAGVWRRGPGFAVFHLAYVAVAVAVLLGWYLAPGASLVLFLALSAWHFGGDWRAHLAPWTRLVSGLGVLALPAGFWPEEVQRIFALLSGPAGVSIAEALGRVAPLLALAMLALGLAGRRRSRATTLELAALVALAWLLPPLAYFAVYFCCLHSLRHLRAARDDVGPAQGSRMLVVALGYTALTLLIAGLAWSWLSTFIDHAARWEDDVLRLLFVGLACLTVPHMLVVGYAEHSRIGK